MLLTIVLVLLGYFFTVGVIHAILRRYEKEKSYNLVLASVIPVALLVLAFGTVGFLGDYLTSEILWRLKKPETTADD